MNVVIAITVITFPCIGLLVIAKLGEKYPAFDRWCDDLFPDTPHNGRLS